VNRRHQVVAVVTDVAKRAGAAIVIEQRTSGHYRAVITINGRTGKIYLAGSPSDRNSYKNAAKAAERKIQELTDRGGTAHIVAEK
jgi:hypothetical protein